MRPEPKPPKRPGGVREAVWAVSAPFVFQRLGFKAKFAIAAILAAVIAPMGSVPAWIWLFDPGFTIPESGPVESSSAYTFLAAGLVVGLAAGLVGAPAYTIWLVLFSICWMTRCRSWGIARLTVLGIVLGGISGACFMLTVELFSSQHDEIDRNSVASIAIFMVAGLVAGGIAAVTLRKIAGPPPSKKDGPLSAHDLDDVFD